MARRSGSPFAARTTSRCWTAARTRRNRGSRFQPDRACRSSRPDGKYGYVCSSFNPETVVITVADHQIVGRVKQDSPFCPNIAATPDGSQVWFTLKDTGKTQVFDAHPPFTTLRILDTGPITNHVNFVRNAGGTFAYVTVGGLNQVKAFRTDDFSQVATIPVGNLPHGIWPSGDGTRVYVGLENADALAAIDTRSNKVIATIPIGQAAQAVTYVSNAVPEGDGRQGLQPLGAAGAAAHFALDARTGRRTTRPGAPPTSVTLFDQGLTQVLQACGERAGTQEALRACPGDQPGWKRRAPATCGIHDQSRWLGHRQRGRPHPAAGPGRDPRTEALPGDRPREGRKPRSAGPGPEPNRADRVIRP